LADLLAVAFAVTGFDAFVGFALDLAAIVFEPFDLVLVDLGLAALGLADLAL
jgi:hypothetical protein